MGDHIENILADTTYDSTLPEKLLRGVGGVGLTFFGGAVQDTAKCQQRALLKAFWHEARFPMKPFES